MPETDINAGMEPLQPRWFVTTPWTEVLAAGHNETPQGRAALEGLCRNYWYPLYSHVRQKGYAPHDAQDLTQDFFARILEKNFFRAADRKKGKFRSFLLVSLNHYLKDVHKREQARKRGGGQTIISLDVEESEDRYRLEPAAADQTPDKIFERRWAQTILDQALARLREEMVATGKAQFFVELKPFLLDEPGAGDYEAAAARLNMPRGTVAVGVHRLRHRYRELVREEVLPTVADPAEADDEMRHLFEVLSRFA